MLHDTTRPRRVKSLALGEGSSRLCPWSRTSVVNPNGPTARARQSPTASADDAQSMVWRRERRTHGSERDGASSVETGGAGDSPLQL